MLKLFTGTHGSTAIQLYKEMWIAGTLGAFFFAMAQGIFIDVETWLTFGRFDFNHTIVRLLSYGYLAWLLAYFFSSTLNAKINPKEFSVAHAIFYIVQSLASLGATFAMGMLDASHGLKNHTEGLAYANLAIAIICAASIAAFWQEFILDWKAKQHNSISELRFRGFVISLIAFVVGMRSHLPAGALVWVYFILQCGLWFVLGSFTEWLANLDNNNSQTPRSLNG